MRWKIPVVILTLLLVITFLYSSLDTIGFDGEKTRATTYYVGAGEIYTTINSALDATSEGDTIIVRPGLYDEKVVLTKQISLIGSGSNNTRITGADTGSQIRIEADGCRIIGFNLSDPQYETYGVFFKSSENVIENCTFYENLYCFYNDGITITNNNTIRNCTMERIRTKAFQYDTGLGLNIDNCYIETLNENMSSVYIEWITNCSISNTVIINRDGIGFRTWACNRVSIKNVTISGRGFALYSIFINDWETTYVDENTTVNDLPILYLCKENNFTTDRKYSQAYIVGCQDVNIYDQTFEGTFDQVFGYWSERIVVNNCHFSKGEFPLLTRESRDIIVTNCSFNENELSDIYLWDCNTGFISDCQFHQELNEDSEDYSIRLEGSSNIEISNSDIIGSEGQYSTGIYSRGNKNHFSNINISKVNKGIYVETYPFSNENIIDNCTIYRTDTAIKFYSSTFNRVENTQIYDSTMGIVLTEYSSYNSFEGCYMENITETGIIIRSSQSNAHLIPP